MIEVVVQIELINRKALKNVFVDGLGYDLDQVCSMSNAELVTDFIRHNVERGVESCELSYDDFKVVRIVDSQKSGFCQKTKAEMALASAIKKYEEAQKRLTED